MTDAGAASGAACTILIHLLLFTWLMRPVARPVAPVRATAINVVWIARTPQALSNPVIPPDPVTHLPSSPTRSLTRPRPRNTSTSRRAADLEQISAPSEMVDDVWTNPQRPNELEFEFDAHPNVFAQSQPDALTVPPKVLFEIRDSSLFGRLRHMSQSGTCNELRAALRASRSADAEVIVRTMQERGCRI